MAGGLAGCGNKATGEALSKPLPSFIPPSSVQPTDQLVIQSTVQPTDQSTIQSTVQPTDQSTIQPTPTLSILGTLFDPNLDLMAGPIDLPIELQIPSLKVNAPMLGVGLTAGNVMDTPKGPIDDPIWHTAFWYRGSSIPGDPGTATIAGHVDDPLGRPEIFAHLQDLHPGNMIIIHVIDTTIDISFLVDQVKVYSIQEASNPVVLAQIFGIGPVDGTGPQPAPDGLSHLTLITCAGYIVNGQFDHYTVVYATRGS